jgi:hypothetical protein
MATEAFNSPYGEFTSPAPPAPAEAAPPLASARNAALTLWNTANASLSVGPDGFVNDTNCFPGYHTYTEGVAVVITPAPDLQKPLLDRQTVTISMDENQQPIVTNYGYRPSRDLEPELSVYRLSAQYTLGDKGRFVELEEQGYVMDKEFVPDGNRFLVADYELGQASTVTLATNLENILRSNKLPREKLGVRINRRIGDMAVRLFRG